MCLVCACECVDIMPADIEASIASRRLCGVRASVPLHDRNTSMRLLTVSSAFRIRIHTNSHAHAHAGADGGDHGRELPSGTVQRLPLEQFSWLNKGRPFV